MPPGVASCSPSRNSDLHLWRWDRRMGEGTGDETECARFTLQSVGPNGRLVVRRQAPAIRVGDGGACLAGRPPWPIPSCWHLRRLMNPCHAPHHTPPGRSRSPQLLFSILVPRSAIKALSAQYLFCRCFGKIESHLLEVANTTNSHQSTGALMRLHLVASACAPTSTSPSPSLSAFLSLAVHLE